METIKLDKNKIDAYINLSQAYRQKGNYNASFDIIKRAKELAPNNDLVKKQYDLAAQEFSANVYTAATNAFESGDYKKAIQEYMKVNPPTADSYIGMAASYQSMNDNVNALAYYKKAFDIDSKNDEIPFYIASIYANQDDLINAKKYVDLSLSKNPNNSKSKDLLNYINAKQNENLLSNAVDLYDKHKYNEAIEQFTKVLWSTPDNATVYYYRAMCYDAMENYQKAITDYKAVLKYAPDMIIAYYSLGVDYDALGKYSDAKSNYKIYVEKSTTDDDYKKYAQSRIDEIK